MVHLVVEKRGGGYHIDSNFVVVQPLPEPVDGWGFHDERYRILKNPVAILEELWKSRVTMDWAREVWCEHWVLDCNLGTVVLDNDWSTRSPMRRIAQGKVARNVV